MKPGTPGARRNLVSDLTRRGGWRWRGLLLTPSARRLEEAAFTIDIRGRQGDRSVRPHFQTVRVRAVVTTGESLAALAAVIEETEARCPVMNLLLDAKVDLRIEWIRRSGDHLETVPRP
jgi:OsmC-like protein